MPDTNRTVTSWACKSILAGEQDPIYYIYLRGRGVDYETWLGNISCTVSPIYPAIFPVTYQSSTRVFSTQAEITTSAPVDVFSYLIEHAIFAFRALLRESQTSNSLVVASIQHLGVQILGMRYEQSDQFLPLYEAMLRGILVDEVCTANNSSPFLLINDLSAGYIPAVLIFHDH